MRICSKVRMTDNIEQLKETQIYGIGDYKRQNWNYFSTTSSNTTQCNRNSLFKKKNYTCNCFVDAIFRTSQRTCLSRIEQQRAAKSLATSHSFRPDPCARSIKACGEGRWTAPAEEKHLSNRVMVTSRPSSRASIELVQSANHGEGWRRGRASAYTYLPEATLKTLLKPASCISIYSMSYHFLSSRRLLL